MKVDLKKIYDRSYIETLYRYQFSLDVNLKGIYSVLDENGTELAKVNWFRTIQKTREKYIGKKGVLISENLQNLPSTDDGEYVLGLFIDKKKVYIMLDKPTDYDEYEIHYLDYELFKKKEPEICSAAVFRVLMHAQAAGQTNKAIEEIKNFLNYAEKFKNPLGNYDCVETPKDVKDGFTNWWNILFNKYIIVPKDLRDRFFAEHDLFKYRAGASGYYMPIQDVVIREVHKFMESKHQDLSTPQKIDAFSEELYEIYVDIKKRYSWYLDKSSKDREWYTPENFIDFGLWENGHELWDDYNYSEYDPSMSTKYIKAKLDGKKATTNFYNLTEKEMIGILKKVGKAPTYQVRFSKVSGRNWIVNGAYIYKNELVLDIDVFNDSTDMSETISWKEFERGAATIRGVRVRIDLEHIKKVMNMIGDLK